MAIGADLGNAYPDPKLGMTPERAREIAEQVKHKISLRWTEERTLSSEIAVEEISAAILAAVQPLEQEIERLKLRLGQKFKRETDEWLKSPAFQAFVELKHGIVGDVLSALQDGEISRGRAAECLAEIAHGAKEVHLPGNGGAFAEDETPAEVVRKLREQLNRVLSVEELANVMQRADSAEARCKALEGAVLWALGESDNFRPREPGEGAYWWRIELARRAALSPAPAEQPKTEETKCQG